MSLWGISIWWWLGIGIPFIIWIIYLVITSKDKKKHHS